MGRHKFWEGIWTIEQRDPSGKVVYREVKKNSLVDQGEYLMLTSFFRNENNPAQFYAGLTNDVMTETSTLVTLTQEPVGFGYARILVPRNSTGFPIVELVDGDYRTQSLELAWTASGGTIGPVGTIFLATSAVTDGFMVAFVVMDTPRVITDGSTLTARFTIRLI